MMPETRRRKFGVRGILAGLLMLAVSCDVRPEPASILLFTGAGTSSGDIAAVERLLDHAKLQYATATSSQLNRMSAPELLAYRLIVIPGGDFMNMSASLSPGTMARIHDAVNAGVNYLGICAGAFIAGDGRGYYGSVNLTSGVRFGFYSAAQRGIRKSVVRVTTVSGVPLDHYWEDGPELSGWGSVVATYPDGAPAIVEGSVGRGFVILAGIHPEAPPSWRRGMSFTTPVVAANAYGETLVQAALTRRMLPHF